MPAACTRTHDVPKQLAIPGSHKDKATGYTPLYAAPEVVSGFMTASPAVVRPSMDTYSVGLVALQVLDVADEPRTSRFAVSRPQYIVIDGKMDGCGRL